MTEKQSRGASHDGIVWNGIVCAILSLSVNLHQIPKAVIATNMHPTVCRTTHIVSALPFRLVNPPQLCIMVLFQELGVQSGCTGTLPREFSA
jgi:hypothetical protein